MTYIPRREITAIIPNKFEAIRVLALECRRLNDEIRAREEGSVEGKLTTLAVQQMLEGKVTYYDAKERREQERSEAMLSAAEGLLDIAEPMMDEDFGMEAMDEAPVEEEPAEAPAEPAAEAAPVEDVEAAADAAPAEEVVVEDVVEEPVAEEASASDDDTEDTEKE